MSHTINFRFYENGQLKKIDRQLIFNSLQPYIQSIENTTFWKIVFEPMKACNLIIDNEMYIDNFAINKPCSSELLAKAILKITDLGYLFSLESDLEKLVIYGKKAIDHFPDELKKGFLENGQFIIIETIEDFQKRFN